MVDPNWDGRDLLKAYVGQTRSRLLIEKLSDLGIGECTCRGELPPRRTPWFYDNGAYKDWMSKKPFNVVRFFRDISRITTDMSEGQCGPDFIVVPDLVAAGVESLKESDSWLCMLKDRAIPLYLAVQDGMNPDDVAPLIDLNNYEGVFVGGTSKWKLETAAQWCELAAFFAVPCHIGRVGTGKKVKWAKEIGASSIDSSFPLWSEEHLNRFLEALHD